jgi:formylglycine-generating enzyme required for sulfatase activity
MIIILVSLGLRTSKPIEIKYDIQSIESDMVFIPTTLLLLPLLDSSVYQNVKNVTFHYNFQPEKPIPSFYIYKYEVSNQLYGLFLEDLKKVNEDEYLNCLPNNLLWGDNGYKFQPATITYFSHPSFVNFPVVGIGYSQTILFCKWLTKKYNSYPNRKFKKVSITLPTREEWMVAAIPDMKQSEYCYFKREFVVPFDHPKHHKEIHSQLYNSKGERLANFKKVDETFVFPIEDSLASRENNSYRIAYESYSEPESVYSFWPNKKGIYNLAGNVEEYVLEKGITKGGSYDDVAFYLNILIDKTYSDTASTTRGFRFVMHVLEE